MKQGYAPYNPKTGLTYYLETGRAWFPLYAQGTLILPWQHYWVTWAEDAVGNEEPLTRAYFPYDPRAKQ